MNFAITGLDDAAHLAALHQSAFAPSLGTPWDEAAFANLLRQKQRAGLGHAGGVYFVPNRGRRSRDFNPSGASQGAPLGLYAACGFTQTGLRPAYYKRPDGTRVDALVLQLQTEG